jgi:hypothetical protein
MWIDVVPIGPRDQLFAVSPWMGFIWIAEKAAQDSPIANGIRDFFMSFPYLARPGQRMFSSSLVDPAGCNPARRVKNLKSCALTSVG